MRRVADPSPIEPLFRAHFEAIYRFAACRVGRDSALDVAAETFAQALRSADRLDPDRDPRAWLFGVANNVLRHHRRAEVRRIRAYGRVADRGGSCDGGDRSEGSPRERLVEALEGLDAHGREALLLLAWADLSYDEIATALDVPVGTVRSRIHRARQSLRAVLADPVASDGPESAAITAAREA